MTETRMTTAYRTPLALIVVLSATGLLLGATSSALGWSLRLFFLAGGVMYLAEVGERLVVNRHPGASKLLRAVSWGCFSITLISGVIGVVQYFWISSGA